MYPVKNIRQASRTGALRATAALLFAAVALGFSQPAASQQRERVVPLGGLFPLSGSWSTQAQTLKAAMEPLGKSCSGCHEAARIPTN